MAGPTSAKTSKDNSARRVEGRHQESARLTSLPARYASVLNLQHSAGNQAVSQLLQSGSGTPEFEPDAVPPIVRSVLNSSGQPLDPATRTFMESRFGHDFSQVRVHIGVHAAESARSVSALAYTVGNNVVFGANQYTPATHHGRELLAHELAHTIQQRTGGGPPSTDSNGIYESSAEAAGRTIANGGAVFSDLPACGVGLSRAPDSTEDLTEMEKKNKEEAARQLQEVTERLKQPNYPGRDRDLAVKEALLMVLKKDEDEPIPMVSMDISRGKPVTKPAAKPATPRDTTPSKFSPGGFADKDIDSVLDPDFAEYKKAEEAVEKVRIEQEKEEDESRPKRLMELRKILYEGGYRESTITDALLKLPPWDRQVLRRHGLEWPKWYTKRATFQSEVIEAIDRYVSETTTGTAPVAKEWTQADQEALDKQDILKAQLEGLNATRGSFLGAVSGGVARLFTEDEETIAAFAKAGAALEGAVTPFAQARGQRRSYVPQVENAPFNPYGTWRYKGPAATVQVNTPKPPAVTSETPPIPTTDVADRSSFSGLRPRTPEDEYADFLRWLRGETGFGELRAAGEPFSMQPHGGAREARQAIGVSGSTHQSMHGLPRSVGRGIPDYNPRAALTMIEQTGIHTGMDAYWKQAFQAMRRSGDTTATAQEIYNTLAESIQRAPDLGQGIKDSLKARLQDEMFVEYGLAPGDVLPLPYPNIPPASTPSP